MVEKMKCFKCGFESDDFTLFDHRIKSLNDDPLCKKCQKSSGRKLITPKQLHDWYLEATKELKPESFNKEAQKEYEDLTEEQKFIDKYIAEKINSEMI